MSNRLAHVLEAKWRSDDVNIKEERDFSSLNLDERILAGLRKAGYKIPSPVQLEAIPMGLTGSDVFVQGKAGTGKTLVFSILALTAVLEAEDLQVLIVAPTREGAFQIYNTIHTIGSEIKDLKCECFIGGFSFAEDIAKTHECRIAVGTPGRIIHLIKEERLKVETIQLYILDEFDELLNEHLNRELNDIFHIIPGEIQKVVASLTCTDEVMNLASEYLRHPFLSCFNKNELSLLGMAHYYYIVPVNFLPLLSYRKKLEVLKTILSKVKFSQCVIFCNSVYRVEPLCVDVQMWGFSVASMSKAKDQVERLRAVELLKKNRCKVFVSTDVSSRGLDAENVDLVINFDMPADCRLYLHRCGRAGRYGAKCSSITFLLKNQLDQFAQIENEGHFNSHALPESIPEYLYCELNPNIVPSLSCNLSTGCTCKKHCLASLTEFNKNPIINLEKTTAGEICSLLTANENGETGVEVVDEGHSILVEEQAVDLEIVNTSPLMGDFEIIEPENECTEDYQDTAKFNVSEPCLLHSYEENAEIPSSLKMFNTNQQPKVFSAECGSKNCEQSSCKIAHTGCRNEGIVKCAIEDICSSSDFSIVSESYNKHYEDSVAVSSECKSLSFNDIFESLVISSDREASEIETKQHLKKTNAGNKYIAYEEKYLCSVSKTVPKTTLKSTSKISEEYVLHKAFDKMHLKKEEKCCENDIKIEKVIQKSKFYKNTRNICNKKLIKSPDHCKSQSKSPERQVMFCNLKTTSSEFDANQTYTKFYSGYPADHMDKKKVRKNHKMHSTCGKCLGRCVHLSPACNTQRSSFPYKQTMADQHCNYCYQIQQTYCNPRPCHPSSQHCCKFLNKYCQPPFQMYRDIHYQQWMFISNFSFFLSYLNF